MVKIEYIDGESEYEVMRKAENFLNELTSNQLINISFVTLDKSNRILKQSDIECIIVYKE